MSAISISYDLAVNAQANAIGALLDGGRCDVYDGDLPTDDAGDVTTLCFSVGFGTPAFLPSRGGVIVANPMTPGKIVCDLLANGSPRRAGWFRACTAAGDAVFRGSVGVKDATMIVPSTFMVPGVTMLPGAFAYVVPKSPLNI
jgi:hypothetical protein